MASNYKIGTSIETLTSLDLLAVEIKNPAQQFKPYTRMKDAGSGAVVGMGWLMDEWEWGFLTDEQRDTLKTFCPGASSLVFIQTHNTYSVPSAWRIYRARMIWANASEGEERAGEVRLKSKIVFRLYEDVTP